MRRERSSGGRARGYHHGDLRSALLEAAAGILEREGIAALSLRGTARKAGVSHAAPAHHFGDLDGLLTAVAIDGFEGLRAALHEALEGAPDALRGLQAVGIAYVRFACERPGRYRAMFHPRLSEPGPAPELRRAGAEAYGVLVSSIAACQAEGSVRSGPVEDLARAAWAAAHGLASLWIDGQLEVPPEGGVESLARGLTATLFEGLRPRPD